MPNAMNYSFNEVYPGMGRTPTLDMDTNPDPEDQKALVQDATVADMSGQGYAKKTPIFAALAVLVVLAFILAVAS